MSDQSKEIEQEATELTQKEEWVQSVAGRIAEGRGIDIDTTEASARWASIWLDEFKRAMEEESPTVLADVKAIVQRTKQSAFERSEGVPKYPTGLPGLKATIAVHDAFCYAFGEESEYARRLLEGDESSE